MVIRSSIFAIVFFGCFSVQVCAQTDIAKLLLQIPAPPRQNPNFSIGRDPYTPGFYNYKSPPHDDAPIEEILAYWRHWNEIEPGTKFTISPNYRIAERILAEIEKDPDLIDEFENVLSQYREAGYRIKDIYESKRFTGNIERWKFEEIERWLKLHSDREIEEIAKLANEVKDVSDVPQYMEELKALVKIDWSRAEPIVTRLSKNSKEPVSQTLSRWLLYKQAAESGDLQSSDVYLGLLQKTVEDRNGKIQNRLFALNRLAQIEDFPDRDEWYLSLLADETLADENLQKQVFAGLTEFVRHAPPDKYVDQMATLMRSSNSTIRDAAARNLFFLLEYRDPRATRALLPWLKNKDWLGIDTKWRTELLETLQEDRFPESVEGLLDLLEKTDAEVNRIDTPINTNDLKEVDRVRAASNRRRNANYRDRLEVIKALGNQKDPQAVRDLIRLLPFHRKKDRQAVVEAIHACGGYVSELQVQILEEHARKTTKASESEFQKLKRIAALTENMRPFQKLLTQPDDSPSWIKESGFGAGMNGGSSGSSSGDYSGLSDDYFEEPGPFNPKEVVPLLLNAILKQNEPGFDFLEVLLSRKLELKQSEPSISRSIDLIGRNWSGNDYEKYLLKGLSLGDFDLNSVVKLLAARKRLRKNNPDELNLALESKFMESRAIGACISERKSDFNFFLESSDESSRSLLYACSRLILAELPLNFAGQDLRSPNNVVALATFRYLEAKDTLRYTKALYDLVPQEYIVLGPRRFTVESIQEVVDEDLLRDLFQSAGVPPVVMGDDFFDAETEESDFSEQKLRQMIRDDRHLLGIYRFQENLVKVYGDRFEYYRSFDPARYRKRVLTDEESENFTALLNRYDAGRMPPFIGLCETCGDSELLLIAKNGGRRIFFSSDRKPQFLLDLEKLFEDYSRSEMKLHYWSENKFSAFEILFGKDDVEIVMISEEQGRYLALLRDVEHDRRIYEKIERDFEKDFDDVSKSYEDAVLEYAESKQYAPLEALRWYELTAKGLGNATSPPVWFRSMKDLEDRINPANSGSDTAELWSDRDISRSVVATESGLFVKINEESVLINEGSYSDPILNLTRTVALARSIDSCCDSSVILFNVLRNQTIRVPPPPGYQTFVPDIYLSNLGRFVAMAGKESNEDFVSLEDLTPFLIDPETGHVSAITEEMLEIARNDLNAGQFVLNSNLKWSTLARPNGTSIIQYDPATFKSKEFFFVPWIHFDVMDLIVDDNGKSARILYNGHLLKISLENK